MRMLLVIGILLILTGAMSASTTGVSGVWMGQAGLVFLFGALAVSRKEKMWTQSGLLFMIVLFLLGFVNGIWYAHPLGAIISIIGGGWVIYRLTIEKEYETRNLHTPLIQELSQKLLNIKQHIKWVSAPLSILLALWLSKSLLIAFIVGFGAVAFLDKQSIQTKGLNRVAVLLLVYAVGFSILIVGTFKIIDPHYGIFYNMGTVFFDRDTHIFLRDITRGL